MKKNEKVVGIIVKNSKTDKIGVAIDDTLELLDMVKLKDAVAQSLNTYKKNKVVTDEFLSAERNVLVNDIYSHKNSLVYLIEDEDTGEQISYTANDVSKDTAINSCISIINAFANDLHVETYELLQSIKTCISANKVDDSKQQSLLS